MAQFGILILLSIVCIRIENRNERMDNSVKRWYKRVTRVGIVSGITLVLLDFAGF